MRLRPCIGIALFLGIASRISALEIDGYSPAVHDRFENSQTFHASGIDFSGVTINGQGRWATLVAPNVFLTATHFPPSTGSTVTFYPGNDPTAAGVTRTVASRTQIGNSDLMLCLLDEAVTEDITSYSVATANLPTGFFWSQYPYFQETVFHLGHFFGNKDPLKMRVGRNKVDVRRPFVTITGRAEEGPAIECVQNPAGQGNFVTHETMAEFDDSGGPLLYEESDGSLTLIGIAWYISNTPSTGFTPVGDYDTDIQAFLTTHESPALPLAPGLLTGTRISDTRIDLAWTDASSIETSYEVERADSPSGPWTSVATLSANATSASDTGAPSGDVHYRVRAVGDAQSAWTEVAVLTPYSAWAASVDWGGADASPLGDANGDGISNLAAYGMVLTATGTIDPADLPTLAAGATSLDYVYRKNPDAADLTFTVRKAFGLLNPVWEDVVVDGVTVTETDLGEDDGARLIRIRMLAPPFDPAAFYRLQIDSDTLP